MPDTPRTQDELLNNLFQAAQPDGSISSQDMRDLIVSLQHNNRSGMFDYNDLATGSSPIAVLANTETKLTNDTNGPQTNTSYPPDGVTSVWNSGNNQFDFSQLSLGTRVGIRITLSLDILSNNTDVEVALHLGLGGFDYHIPLDQSSHKVTGTKTLSRYIGFYIGDANTRDSPGEIHVTSDQNINVTVEGWYLDIEVR